MKSRLEIFFTKLENGKPPLMVVSIVGCLLVFLLVHRVWLGDDCFITFRTIDNFLNGYGLTYNPGERVQAFTHPLWLLVISGFSFFTGNIPVTAICISVLALFLSGWIIFIKIFKGTWTGFLALLILSLSQSFMDYSSSGLENPLSFLLWLTFFYFWSKNEPIKYGYVICLVAGLIAFNRLDTILFIVPALVFFLINSPKATAIRQILIGFLPFLFWLGFTLVYYGFLLPNTAYAKLHTGIPISEYLVQGLHYYNYTLEYDPLTICFIFLALVFIFLKRKQVNGLLPLWAGCVLYLGYIVWIGGDFMAGRFFSIPLLVCVILYFFVETHSIRKVLITVSMVPIGLMVSGSPWFKTEEVDKMELLVGSNTGIVNERQFYLSDFSIEKGFNLALNPNRIDDTQRELKNHFRVEIGPIGYAAFVRGPGTRFYDIYALVSPFLARLPMDPVKKWRVGHFERKIPIGFFESKTENRNAFENDRLRDFYKRIKTVISDDLFAFGRLKEIAKFQFWQNENMVPKNDFYAEVKPYQDSDNISNEKPSCFKPGEKQSDTLFNEERVKLYFDTPKKIKEIKISVSQQQTWVVSLSTPYLKYWTENVVSKKESCDGLASFVLKVPNNRRGFPCSMMMLEPVSGKGPFIIGHFFPEFIE